MFGDRYELRDVQNYDNHRLFFGSVLFYAVCKIKLEKQKLLDGSTVSGSD